MAGRPRAGSAVLCCAMPGRWEEGGLFPQSFSLMSLQSGCLLCPGLEAMPAALPRCRQSPRPPLPPLTVPLVSGGRKGLKYAAVGLHTFQVTPCTLAAYPGNADESSWEVRTQTSSKCLQCCPQPCEEPWFGSWQTACGSGHCRIPHACSSFCCFVFRQSIPSCSSRICCGIVSVTRLPLLKKKKNNICCRHRKHNKTYESLRRAAVGGHAVKPQFSEVCLTNEDKAP